MKRTLFEITGDALAIYQDIEEQGTGELTEEQEQALTINQNELQSKGIAYLEVIKDRTAFVSNVDAEIKRLQAMKKANNKLIERLKDGLFLAQQSYGDIELGLTTITTRASKSVDVDDINSLPNEYKTIKIVETADKIAIKNALN